MKKWSKRKKVEKETWRSWEDVWKNKEKEDEVGEEVEEVGEGKKQMEVKREGG